MPRKSRGLTIEDVARIVALTASTRDSDATYRSVEAIAAGTVGFVSSPR